MNVTETVDFSTLETLGFTLDSTLDLLALIVEEINEEYPYKCLSEKEQATRAKILGFRAPFLRALALASSKMIKEVQTELDKIEKHIELAMLDEEVIQ